MSKNQNVRKTTSVPDLLATLKPLMLHYYDLEYGGKGDLLLLYDIASDDFRVSTLSDISEIISGQADLETFLNNLTAKDIELESLININKNNIDILNDKVLILENSYNILDGKVDDLTVRVVTLEDLVNGLVIDVDNLNTIVDTLGTKVETNRVNIETLQTDLLNLKGRVDILEIDLENIDSTVKDLSSDMNTVKSDISNINTNIDNINVNIENINNNIEDITGKVNTNTSSIEDLNATVDIIDESIVNLTSLVNTNKSSIDTINETLDTLSVNIENNNIDINNIKNTISSIETNIDNIESSISTLNTSVSNIQTSIESINTELQEVDNHLDTIDEAMSVIFNTISDHENRISLLEDKPVQSRNRILYSIDCTDPYNNSYYQWGFTDFTIYYLGDIDPSDKKVCITVSHDIDPETYEGVWHIVSDGADIKRVLTSATYEDKLVNAMVVVPRGSNVMVWIGEESEIIEYEPFIENIPHETIIDMEGFVETPFSLNDINRFITINSIDDIESFYISPRDGSGDYPYRPIDISKPIPIIRVPGRICRIRSTSSTPLIQGDTIEAVYGSVGTDTSGDLVDRIIILESNIVTLNNNIVAINTSISNIESDIDTVQTTLLNHEDRISNLENPITPVSNNIAYNKIISDFKVQRFNSETGEELDNTTYSRAYVGVSNGTYTVIDTQNHCTLNANAIYSTRYVNGKTYYLSTVITSFIYNHVVVYSNTDDVMIVSGEFPIFEYEDYIEQPLYQQGYYIEDAQNTIVNEYISILPLAFMIDNTGKYISNVLGNDTDISMKIVDDQNRNILLVESTISNNVFPINVSSTDNSTYFKFNTLESLLLGTELNFEIDSLFLREDIEDNTQSISDLNERISSLEPISIDSEPTENSTNAVSSGGVYSALTNKVDTDDSRLTDARNANDVYAWAKEENKPSYTAAEVGALPSNTFIPDSTSDITNDSGFITNTVDNLVNYYIKTDLYNNTEIDALLDNYYTSNDVDNISTLANYYDKSLTFTKDEINALISAGSTGIFIFVDTLPETGESNKIYLIPNEDSTVTDNKDEYIWDTVNSKWELIGSTKLDLEGYVTDQDLTNALTSYVTSTGLNNILVNYVTIESLNNTLSLYSTTSQINTILDSYVLASELSTTLNNYATKEYADSLIVGLATSESVTTALDNKVDKSTYVNAGSGMINGGQLDADVYITMGTPSTITSTSTNSTTDTSHTHAIHTASISQQGIVQLNDTLTSTSTELGLTANQGKVLSDMISSITPSIDRGVFLEIDTDLSTSDVLALDIPSDEELKGKTLFIKINVNVDNTDYVANGLYIPEVPLNTVITIHVYSSHLADLTNGIKVYEYYGLKPIGASVYIRDTSDNKFRIYAEGIYTIYFYKIDPYVTSGAPPIDKHGVCINTNIIDALSSSNSNLALSANQGNILSNRLTDIENNKYVNMELMIDSVSAFDQRLLSVPSNEDLKSKEFILTIYINDDFDLLEEYTTLRLPVLPNNTSITIYINSNWNSNGSHIYIAEHLRDDVDVYVFNTSLGYLDITKGGVYQIISRPTPSMFEYDEIDAIRVCINTSIIDDLVTTDSLMALSANQGKLLNDRVSTLELNISNNKLIYDYVISDESKLDMRYISMPSDESLNGKTLYLNILLDIDISLVSPSILRLPLLPIGAKVFFFHANSVLSATGMIITYRTNRSVNKTLFDNRGSQLRFTEDRFIALEMLSYFDKSDEDRFLARIF